MDLRVPPGPPLRQKGLFSSIGYAYQFFRDPFGFVGGRFDKYGDVYYAPTEKDRLYVIRHPDHVRQVLVTEADAFEKTHSAFDRLGQVLGQGLLTTDGEVWRRHRRIMNPAFAKRAIVGYVPAMAREAAVSIERLRRGGELDVDKEMVDLTLRIVGKTLLGIELSEDVERVGAAMRVFQTMLAAPGSLPKAVLWPVERRIARATRDLDEVIERVLEARSKTPPREPDLLQMLLDAVDPDDASVRLSPRELRDELVTFLLAGHETTSNTLTWALYLLSRAPEVRERLDQELASLGGAPLDPDKLPYAEQIVKETMRLYPPAYVLARRAARDTTIGEYRVPAGSEVVVWIYFTHRDPRFYPDPTAFKPERFAPEEESKLPKQAFVPFGAGPRACIGKLFAQVEATVVLAALARDLRFEYLGTHPPKPQPRITLSPAGGLRMRVQAR